MCYRRRCWGVRRGDYYIYTYIYTYMIIFGPFFHYLEPECQSWLLNNIFRYLDMADFVHGGSYFII